MSLRPPTEEEIRELGADLHLDLTDEEVRDYRKLVSETLEAYETVRDCGRPPSDVQVEYGPRDPGNRVRDDPYNA